MMILIQIICILHIIEKDRKEKKFSMMIIQKKSENIDILFNLVGECINIENEIELGTIN